MKRPKTVNYMAHGDAIDLIDELPDNSIDLFLFSPPYDALRDYAKEDKNWDVNLLQLAVKMHDKLVDGGVVIMVIQDQTENSKKSLTTFKTASNWEYYVGLHLWECLIYQRPGNPGAWWSKRFRVDHEYILVFFKGKKPQYFSKEHMKVPCKHAGKDWTGTQRHTDGSLSKRASTVQDTKCPGTILSYASSNTEGNKLKLKHPATFPDKLASDMIQAFTTPGMVVCDPMCGSGTTLVQAKKLNRKYVGFDINPEYIKIAAQRLEEEV